LSRFTVELVEELSLLFELSLSLVLLVLSLLLLLSLLPEPEAPPGPPGGGPPGPPAPPGPPGPPFENALEKTFCSSVAWLLVSLPFCTSCAIKLSIFDFMSDGDGGEDDELLCSALLMSVSAELSALLSDELIVPLDTCDVSSSLEQAQGRLLLEVDRRNRGHGMLQRSRILCRKRDCN
jgi:hypothetical protein